jgi:hypothetical protein
MRGGSLAKSSLGARHRGSEKRRAIQVGNLDDSNVLDDSLIAEI